MNRIVNLKVLFPIAAAIAFILFACSSQVPSVNEPEPSPEPGPIGQVSSSSISSGGSGVSSSSQSVPGGTDDMSSQSTTQTSSDSGQASSSSASVDDNSSSSSLTCPPGGTCNTSSSSRVVSSSSAGTQNASSSSRSSSSSTQNIYSSSVRNSSSSALSSSSSVPVPSVDTPKADFKEKVGSVEFDMIYIPGGTFTIGCEKSSGCPSDTKPVSGVVVSNYFISKTEVTTALWNAVMGGTCTANSYYNTCANSYTNMTWYDAMEFACKLGNMTGRKYRMTTEAEWEYAAKNHKDELSNIGSGEEWAYNSWNSTHSGGTDPVGPSSGAHTQKTRRDAQGTTDNITGRLIRSIEGMGPALRLAVSADVSYPPTYVSPCDLHAPKVEGEPTNSYRDPRWVTGSGAMWVPNGTIAIGGFGLRTWEDGTARLCSGYMNSCANGQWFTSNNISLVFVPTSGSIKKYAYIFLDEKQGSLISGDGFANGYIGRIEKRDTTSYDKPTVSGLKSSGEELAKAQTNFETEFKMVDMTNIPASAQKQDPRLMDEDTPDAAKKGWFQDNTSAGGVHHYRKDVDPSEFRFTVNQNNGRTMLANGKWFTVNNTFLRVVHEKTGYTAEYLYAVDADGTFYHNSFMGYERGDFRMFKLQTNASWPQTTCGAICSEEIPKGLGVSMYNSMANGKSTFEPAPCPTGGCK